MPNLFSLPNELLCHILKELEPLDLLRIGRVCKLALSIVSERAVWEKALLQVYAHDSLFEPSFEPIHSMDLDSLRKATFRTQLVHSKLSEDSGTVYPTRETLLSCPVEGADFRYIQGVQIVPGGRYIIGVASNKHICLWDMGPPGIASGRQEGTLLCTQDVECMAILSMTCPSQVSEDSFRFAVCVFGEGSEYPWINVYSVGPLPNVARIQLLTDRNHRLSFVPGEFMRYWTRGDKLFLQRKVPDALIIWDFVCGTVTSAFIPRDAANKSYEFVDFGESVVAIQENQLYASRLQALQPFDPEDSSAGPPNSAQKYMHRTEYQNDHATDTGFGSMWTALTFLLPSNWTKSDSPANSSTTVDTICYSRRPMIVKRLRLHHSGERDVSAHVLSISDSGLESLVSPDKQEQHRYYSRGGSNLYVVGSSIRSGVFIHYSSLEDDEGEEKWKAVKCALGHGIRGRASTLLCPYSGRFAYVCRDAHDDGCNRIHVIDLLDQ